MNYASELNQNQLDAVTATSRITRVIAGAGSGKTRVLTYRIHFLINELKANPFSILAITFTNKVAKEMSHRLNKLLAKDYDYDNGVHIYTYHSLCARLLRIEGEVLGYPKNFTILDDQDQELILKKIFRRHKISLNDKDLRVSRALRYITSLKKEGLYPNDVDVDDLKDAESKFYQQVFEEYEEAKTRDFALDFDDLLLKTRDLFRDFPLLRKKYQQKFRYVLIDEFQDTNLPQYEIIQFLINDDNHLYVVGDPDQTIYSWRGASQDIIISLDQKYPETKTIVLDQNYRSTKNILDRANQLIKYNKGRLEKNLVTSNGKGQEVIAKDLETSAFEARYVVDRISELIESGVKRRDIVILFRANSASKDFEKELLHRRIPYRVFGESVKFFHRQEIKDVVSYLQLIANDNANFAVERILNVPGRGIGVKYANCLYDECAKTNLSLINFFKLLPTIETEIPNKIAGSLCELSDLIRACRKELEGTNRAPSEIVKEFLTKIEYYGYLKDGDRYEERQENIETLLQDIDTFMLKDDVTLSDYLQQISLLSSQDDLEDKDFVSLMTIHTAKGLEFDYVFVVCSNDHAIPNARAVNERGLEGLEEERRLLYVAFTRAKKRLYVTMNYSFNGITHERSKPSRFLYEAGFFFKERVHLPSSPINIHQTSVIDAVTISSLSLSKTKENELQPGDYVMHTKYQKGQVIEVSDNKIKVQFDDGLRILISPHPSFHKIK
ncbi:MAG: UvrD-helicase domain-containing protein [Erysipelotrichaceae bacterium]|jgi:DNA helicase-2/ATP-dependent DNA helicase PcrA|nr:UvrD-helicase domain-containing protein [Erysipelotrichaceae bacterium]